MHLSRCMHTPAGTHHAVAMRKLSAATLCSCMLGTAHAGEHNPLDAKFMVDAGWFFASTDVRVRVDGESTAMPGTDIDLEDTFDIGSFERFRAEALWRVGGRHALRAMYFATERSATRSTDRDILFRDTSFPLSTSITARSQLDVAQFSYEYAFVRKDDYEIAGGIGVHWFDMGLRLSGTLAAQGGSVSNEAQVEASTEAPLPVLGVRGLWRLSPDFYLAGQVQYFYIELDPYSGSLVDLKASLLWQATDRLGIGVAYNDFRFGVDLEGRRDFDGRLRWNYGGAFAYMTLMF